jgi:hypothetical protein
MLAGILKKFSRRNSATSVTLGGDSFPPKSAEITESRRKIISQNFVSSSRFHLPQKIIAAKL